ncbi:bifunctional Proteasome subunit beta 2/Proteasome [Babesia duncani]|uniref:Proteasome subunit beta n=1 Tax=Babesia duncani TaxID=323732 RepID=A0AAD9PM97_9APIC|nr:bifunctional Proteasome subunit beta 2/Proteasome [Babesia duncani]
MDTLIGICGQDFVALAGDTYEKYSVIILKNHEDNKIQPIGKCKLMLLGGPLGDRLQFGDYIKRTLDFFKYKNSIELSTKATAHFIRLELAKYLRKSPYRVDVIVAGIDEDGPQMFWIDYLASCAKVETAAHGYGGLIIRGLLDREYNPNLTVGDAVNVLKKCRLELKSRFLLSQSNFCARVITNDGIQTVDLSADEDVMEPQVFQKTVDIVLN